MFAIQTLVSVLLTQPSGIRKQRFTPALPQAEDLGLMQLWVLARLPWEIHTKGA